MKRRRFIAAAAFAALPAPALRAQGTGLRIGMLTTLSGPGSSLGIDVRDGFGLALEHLGGRIGGSAVQVFEADDQQRPDTAVTTTQRMLERDRVQVVTGTIWSNLALAMLPIIQRAGAVYLSPNAGPSQLAGAGCSRHFFNVAFQNDSPHEAMGEHAARLGLRNVVILAPNYPAGQDAAAGFRRFYDRAGGRAQEIFTRLGQLDFAAEIARVQSMRPDGVYFFFPGGMGINFVKQWAQSGIRDIRLLGSGFSLSEDTLPAMGEAALGLPNAAHWSPDLDNAVNRRFVADFRGRRNRMPSLYAAQGYDAVLLLDAAARRAGATDARGLLGVLPTTTFDSTRGPFRFDRNGFPLQNQYLRVVAQLPDGTVANRIEGTIFENHRDAYVAECRA